MSSAGLPPTRVRPAAEQLCSIGPGTRLLNGRFEIELRLGQGGMGTVFRALDLQAQTLRDPNPRIALKMLSEATLQSLPEARLALQRELSRARKLTHPNIVRVHEFYQDGVISFITMELLEGRPWDAVMDACPRGMPLGQARPLIEQLCAALAYAHGEGVVHSDLKPQNLFLTREQQVKVLDFGIAARIRRTTTDSPQMDTVYNPRQMLAMTRRYACQEMWEGLDADPRDDVYSAACIVFELLAGSHPFGGLSALEAYQQGLIPNPIKSLSRAQNRALRHALELSREKRTLTIAAFAAELLGPGSACSPAASSSPHGRRAGWAWLCGAATAAAVIAAALLLAPPWQLLRQPARQAARQLAWLTAPRAARPPVRQPPREAVRSIVRPTPAPAPDTVSADAALSLARSLGMTTTPFQPGSRYTRAEVLDAVAHSPRRVTLGSTPQQIAAALALCRHASTACQADWYADETPRTVVLRPFSLDPAPVTVRAFRAFIGSTHYRTDAERAGHAYSFAGGQLRWMPGGTWANNAGTGVPSDQAAVVGVSFNDAQVYCRWRGARLPTEDEWEYAARGPAASVFPWGNDPGPARIRATVRPAAAAGPPEGADGSLRGLAGNVWQWVDTPGVGGPGRMVLKGGSWLEGNPANQRSAARRTEVATRADSDSGFRCARSQAEWPDARFWLSALH